MNYQATNADPTGNLQVGSIIGASFGSTFGNLGSAFKLSLIPALMVTLLVLLSTIIAPFPAINPASGAMPDISPLALLMQLTVFIGAFAAGTLFFVAWVRFLLKGEDGITASSPLNWRMYHWTTLGQYLLVGIIATLSALAICLVVGAICFGGYKLLFEGSPDLMALGVVLLALAGIGIWIAASIIFLRLAYVLPAAALNERYEITTSWRHTRGQGFRLFAIFFVMILSVTAVQIVLSIIIGVGFGIFAAVLGLTAGGLGGFENAAQSMMENQTLIMLLLSPLYFLIYWGIFVVQTPLVAMFAHCFKAGSGWMNDKELAEQFS